MMYELPTTIEINGAEYAIRSDYRAVLDICAALNDAELNEQDRALVVLTIFYPDFAQMPPDHYDEAIRKCFWFINCGAAEQSRKTPKLMDWEQDFPFIIAPVNRVLGSEARAMAYLHWWTFIAAYYEIGDCTFAQIVRVRERRAKGKRLDQADREWYRNNRRLVDLKTTYTEREEEVLSAWLGKKKPAP